MSAPRTNIEKQKRRHIVPLLGMAVVVVFAVGLILYWQFEEAAQGDAPGVEEPSDPGATPRLPSDAPPP
jgi:flagellar basal body-associated protein FliL